MEEQTHKSWTKAMHVLFLCLYLDNFLWIHDVLLKKAFFELDYEGF